MSEELLEKSISDWNTYNPGTHKDIKKIIQDNINSVCANYVAIGYYLNVVNDRELYKEDGYSGIGEYAAAEYGIQKDRCSWLMKIADRFCIENSPALKPDYKDFSISKLREMVYLDDKQLEQVTITSTVAEIKGIRKPEKVATSQLETEPDLKTLPKLCKWDGKLNCVAMCDTKAECCAECPDHGSCNCECGWQDERMPKPSGKCIHRSEFPCTLPEASKLAQGDGVNCNAKCCWNCPKRNECGYQCNSSAHRTVEKPTITEDDFIIGFYRHMYDSEKQLVQQRNIEQLRTELINNHGKRYENTNCILDGWTSGYPDKVVFRQDNQSTQIQLSWGRVVSRIFKLVDEGRIIIKPEVIERTEVVTESVTPEPEYIESVSEAEESVIEEPEIVVNEIEDEEEDVPCRSCKYDTMNPDEYLKDHPGVTLPCIACDDKFSSWQPKVKTSKQGEFLPCDTCGYDVQGCCDYENEDMHCVCGDQWKPIELDPVETIEADIIETTYVTDDSGKEAGIEEVIRCAPTRNEDDPNCPAGMGPKRGGCTRPFTDESFDDARSICKWCWDAYLRRLIDEDRNIKEPVEIKTPVPVQPELPILKNNDQRKEWAENYKAWGEWYYDEHIDCHYYKFDFENGDRLVVEEYLNREQYWGNNKKDEQYYHFIQKHRQKYESNKTFEKKYSHDTASMTEIVEYLKDFQKKGA